MVISATTITLAIVGLLFSLIAFRAVEGYLNYRKSGVFSFNWAQIIAYCDIAVVAVAQTKKVKPDGMSDAEWNSQRLQIAVELVVNFAKQFGITLDADGLLAIESVIEQAVLKRKESLVSGITALRSAPAFPL